MMGLPCGCDDGTRSCSPKHEKSEASVPAEASLRRVPAVEERRSSRFADAWMAGGQALGWATPNGDNGGATAEELLGLAAAQRVAKKREAATLAPERGRRQRGKEALSCSWVCVVLYWNLGSHWHLKRPSPLVLERTHTQVA